MAVFTCFLGVKAWNTGGIIWNHGILAKSEAFGLQPRQEPLVSLTHKHVEPPFWSAKFHRNSTKKTSGFPINTNQTKSDVVVLNWKFHILRDNQKLNWFDCSIVVVAGGGG